MHSIAISVQGHHCRAWPYLAVRLNGHVLHDLQIEHDQTLLIECQDIMPTNILSLEHHGKQFGDHGIYDTDLQLSLDRGITIKDIRFDDVTIGQHKIQQLQFRTKWTHQQILDLDADFLAQRSQFACNGYMGFNGTVDLEFWTPIMEWLGVYKYKTDLNSNIAYFSGFDQRWHYDNDLELIREIRELMQFE